MCRNISSCAETLRHAVKISRMQVKTSRKIHAKFTQNSRKIYIIETQKIKKVHAVCENRRTSAETVLYMSLNNFALLFMEVCFFEGDDLISLQKKSESVF